MTPRWSFSVLCLLISGLFQTSLAGRPDTTGIPGNRGKAGFAWGVNGHPLNQAAYFDNIGLQLRMLRSMGMSYYRVDMAHDENGAIAEWTKHRFDELIKKAADDHITIIPLIFPMELKALYQLPDPGIAYDKGLILGNGFASRYGRYFHYYELGNENDGDLIVRPPGDGADTSQYDMVKLKLLAGFLRGMADGIRHKEPDARIIISNAGWRHYAYFDLLEREGVKFDIIGYHWYDDIPNLRKVLRKLKRNYADKTVWFTEINMRGGSIVDSNSRQKKLINSYIRVIKHAGRNIQGCFMYELFDQPTLPPDQRTYGIFQWQRPGDSVSLKPAANVIKKWTGRKL